MLGQPGVERTPDRRRPRGVGRRADARGGHDGAGGRRGRPPAPTAAGVGLRLSRGHLLPRREEHAGPGADERAGPAGLPARPMRTSGAATAGRRSRVFAICLGEYPQARSSRTRVRHVCLGCHTRSVRCRRARRRDPTCGRAPVGTAASASRRPGAGQVRPDRRPTGSTATTVGVCSAASRASQMPAVVQRGANLLPTSSAWSRVCWPLDGPCREVEAAPEQVGVGCVGVARRPRDGARGSRRRSSRRTGRAAPASSARGRVRDRNLGAVPARSASDRVPPGAVPAASGCSHLMASSPRIRG